MNFVNIIQSTYQYRFAVSSQHWRMCMPCFLFFLSFFFYFWFIFNFLSFSNLYHVELVHEIPLAVMETPSLLVNLKYFLSSGVTVFVSFPFGIIQSWSSTVFSLSASVALRVEDRSCALRLNQPPHEARTHEWHVKLVSDQQPGDLLHTSTRTVSQYVSGSVSLCFESSGAILVTLVVLCMQGALNITPY